MSSRIPVFRRYRGGLIRKQRRRHPGCAKSSSYYCSPHRFDRRICAQLRRNSCVCGSFDKSSAAGPLIFIVESVILHAPISSVTFATTLPSSGDNWRKDSVLDPQVTDTFAVTETPFGAVQKSTAVTSSLLVRFGPAGICSHSFAVEIIDVICRHSGLFKADQQPAEAKSENTADNPTEIQTTSATLTTRSLM